VRPGDASGARGIAVEVGATAAGTALSTLVSDDAGWSRTSVPTGSASVKASVAAASAYRARAARAGTTASSAASPAAASAHCHSECRSEEHTSELQSPDHLVCRLLLEKKKK